MTKQQPMRAPRAVADHRELLSGFVRIHVLFHASEQPLYGSWMIQELARHGYRLSAGTLYPMLHAMERKGYLRSSKVPGDGAARRVYRTTALGRRALNMARDKLRDLIGEVMDG
jgi:PadR family transcriptional regulator